MYAACKAHCWLRIHPWYINRTKAELLELSLHFTTVEVCNMHDKHVLSDSAWKHEHHSGPQH